MYVSEEEFDRLVLRLLVVLAFKEFFIRSKSSLCDMIAGSSRGKVRS